MDCKNCKTFYCPEHGFNFEKQCNRYTPPTNADRIRAMTDEELAEWIVIITTAERRDRKPWLDWLRQEVKE